MEFFDWKLLGEYTGAVLAVGILTEMTKEIPGIRAIPTQLWSYALSVLTLLLAEIFTAGVSAQGAVLALFNAAVVSLAANGGFNAVQRVLQPQNNE